MGKKGAKRPQNVVKTTPKPPQNDAEMMPNDLMKMSYVHLHYVLVTSMWHGKGGKKWHQQRRKQGQ